MLFIQSLLVTDLSSVVGYGLFIIFLHIQIENEAKGENMTKFQLIEVKAPTPYERGVQYGEQASEKICAGIDDYRLLFAETCDMSWETIKKNAMAYVLMVERIFPEIIEEIRGISVGAGVGIDEIMVLNARYEITKFPRLNECTSFAILPEASNDNETYIGQLTTELYY